MNPNAPIMAFMLLGSVGVFVLSVYFVKFLEFRREDERRKKRKVEDFNRAIEHILERVKLKHELDEQVEQKKVIRVNFKDKNRRDNEPPAET
jgi:Flp pilus assembly protein TadB|tara:strand:+ start:327 stop:602 length:276 start_codon:yes stop_codon:yes gene_type:complete